MRIATEPVTAPATSLSSDQQRVGDDRDRRRARALAARRRACAPRRAHVREPFPQRAGRMPAVRDRVLLVVGAARPSCAARRRGRTPGRSRSRARRRAAAAIVPSQAPSNSVSVPSGSTWAITHTYRSALPGRDLLARSGRGSPRRSRPRRRSARCARPGGRRAPRPRCPESSAIAARPVAAAAARALISALSA